MVTEGEAIGKTIIEATDNTNKAIATGVNREALLEEYKRVLSLAR